MAFRRSRTRLIESDTGARAIDEVRSLSRPLDTQRDLEPLLSRVGDARFVLLGEASHGTSDFYTWRYKLSQRLILEKGFSFIAVEGDWPDCYRVNRFVQGYAAAGENAQDVLQAFARWPTWMWANQEVVQLVSWLREHNDQVPQKRKVGFYGLDMYSLWDSMHAVLRYLESSNGAAVAAARKAFECFEPYANVEDYARASMWIPDTCQDEVIRLLQELRSSAPRYAQDGQEDYFNAEQNAVVAKNAEQYYRTMVRGDTPSWNIRDGHMVETLDRLIDHHGPAPKAIVWEHNTHIGDARATDMAQSGMVNVGQLVRERHAQEGVVLVGFSSHRGTVIAGDEWGAPIQEMNMPPGRAGSWEDLLHKAAPSNKLLLLDEVSKRSVLHAERGHRAIGVVYRPEYERYGNYVPTVMPQRYDALLYIDETRALAPLHMPVHSDHDAPETFPTGL